ncbi:RidA family protein [bacterium]|nr:RidA family protein [bacterium]
MSSPDPLGLDGKTHRPFEAGPQARRCLEIIQSALQKLGANLSDVVRTRIFLTQVEVFPAVARVHGEFFHSHPPVCTCVVTGLLDPDWRVEIEAYARLSEQGQKATSGPGTPR